MAITIWQLKETAELVLADARSALDQANKVGTLPMCAHVCAYANLETRVWNVPKLVSYAATNVVLYAA